MIDPAWVSVLSAILFIIGVWGAFTRKNAIIVLMCLELILNAANLQFVAKTKKMMVSVVEATSISGIPLIEQFLGLLGPFVSLNATWEELDGFVNLVF